MSELQPRVTFVSALFLPPGGSYRSVDKYKEYFRLLAATGIPIRLYLDPAFHEYGEELQREWANVRVAEYCLPEKSFLEGVRTIHLPTNRNHAKDTVDYMCVQLMKLNVLARAAATAGATEALAWIDFGIFHMFKDVGAATAMLQVVAAGGNWIPADKILSPGCWDAGSYPIWKSICWRHCGSFLLGKKELFAAAFEAQKELVRVNLPGLTWEVNYWNELERLFLVYKADHNEKILLGLMSLAAAAAATAAAQAPV